jgi:hypothetical protein
VILNDLVLNPDKCRLMANQAYKLRKVEVVQQFHDVISGILGG